MPLRPPEFVVTDPSEPFEKDLLDRKPRIEALTRVILGEEGPAVISVNGGFGSGKSAFLKMLAANLRLQDGIDVQEFDAWQQSFAKDPVVDVVSALAEDREDIARRLLPIAGKLVGRLAWRVLSQLVKAATVGSVDIEGVDLGTSDESGGFEAWSDAQSRVDEFKRALEEIVGRSESRLVVIVDELDRCRPDYAIDMLNVLRHLFAVPGVVVVLGVNQEELEHRVVEVFGPKTKADVYLRRFVDLPVDLRPLDEQMLDAFSRHTLSTAGLSGQDSSGSLKAVLELLVTEKGASVRDIQQAVRRVALIGIDENSQDRAAREMAVAALLLLRHLSRPAYEALVANRCDALEAIAAIRSALSGVRNAGTQRTQTTLEFVELMILNMLKPGGYSMAETPGFEGLYVKAQLGNKAEAQQARRDAEVLPQFFLHELADLIELFV